MKNKPIQEIIFALTLNFLLVKNLSNRMDKYFKIILRVTLI